MTTMIQRFFKRLVGDSSEGLLEHGSPIELREGAIYIDVESLHTGPEVLVKFRDHVLHEEVGIYWDDACKLRLFIDALEAAHLWLVTEKKEETA